MKFPLNLNYLILAIVLVAGTGWIIHSSTPWTVKLPHNIPEEHKDLIEFFQSGGNLFKECSNEHYETVSVNTAMFSGNLFSKYLQYGIWDAEDILNLELNNMNQLDRESYVSFGRALAWQTCNGNMFFTDAALKRESGSNLILNINHPFCTIWKHSLHSSPEMDNTPYQYLHADPGIPGNPRVKAYSAAETLRGLDCLKSLSVYSAIYSAVLPSQFYLYPERNSFASISLADLAEHTPNLISLDISRSFFDNLEPIKGLGNLEYLYMRKVNIKKTADFDLSPNSPVSDLTKHLSSLKNLKVLDLSETKAGYLTHLYGLENLRMLILSKTRTPHLGGIGQLQNLKYLDVSDTTIGDLGNLNKITGLRYLNISNTHVLHLNQIEGLENLIELDISNNKTIFTQNVWGDNLSALKSLKKLSKIDATGTVSKNQCDEIKKLLENKEISC
ncbi:MAG: hypothetical protein U9M89_02145 [Patescibacteria group bacterium]|nr:hypothetical protein [Patescibacteria group bacterium]